ncbi:MAG: tetratricopeptide repeat protein [Planctomycetes bacterium]|nr:tetratricopeptide repeat protein [Planctomycetota bacterium]
MGRVYLATADEPAEGVEPGDRVAMKVIHPHLLAGIGMRERFAREGTVGRRVRHENVVRTLQAGASEIDGETVNWLAMEFVEGRMLRQLLATLGPLPEGLLREIAAQAAAGLVAIHEAGAVHRDLKPENLLISADQRVRIMDLGIARLIDPSAALTTEGQFAGTLHYAAPEQFRGTGVGPSADLYSLGVVLYEMATGDNPFRHEEPGAVMRAHLHSSPPPLGEVRPEFSAFFGEVISILLAKDPAGRFASAAELERILLEGEGGAWWRAREQARAPGTARLPRIPVRKETRFIGRGAELLALRASWDGAVRGEGRVVLLLGEAGIGKSRLVDRFLSEVPPDRTHVLYGGYHPAGGPGGFSDAIIGRFGGGRLEEVLGPYLRHTPDLVPAIAARVRQTVGPEGAPAIGGDTLQAVMVDFMRALAAERPLLWVVDDLQFAEPESRRIALAMARAVEGHRVMLLLVTRPGLPAEELAEFGASKVDRKIEVGRLSPREVVELLRDVLRGEAVAERLGGKIAWKSDGVPFFILEIVRGLAECGLIARRPDGSFVETRLIDAIEVPSTVRDMIEARLKELRDDERALLDVAAVQGLIFDADPIARVRDMKRVVVLEKLAAVARRTGVIRAEGPRFRFDHQQLMEVVYDGLPESLRREYHSLLSETRRALVGELSGEDACFVASHGLLGARPAEALPFLDRALAHLESVYRSESAIRLAELALAVPDGLAGTARAEVLFRKAQCEETLGRRDAQRKTLEEARQIAAESGDPVTRARALNGLAAILVRSGRTEEARADLLLALDLARGAGDTREELSAMLRLGTCFHSVGEFEDARKWFELHLARSREKGDRWGERASLGNLAVVLANLGRPDEALELHEGCLAILRELGDRRGEAMTSGNLGSLLSSLGRHEQARARLSHALSICREIGYRQGEANASGNLGAVFSALGRPDRAVESYRKSLALLREIGDAAGEGRTLVNIGAVLDTLGDRRAAREHLEGGLAIALRVGDRMNAGYARQALGRLAQAEGNFEAAEKAYRETWLDRKTRGYRSAALESLIGLGDVLMRAGRAEEAGEALAEALVEARDLGSPAAEAVTIARLGLLGKAPAEEVEAAMRRAEGRMTHEERLEVSRLLYRITGDPAALEKARALLLALADHLPADRRNEIMARDPRYREIFDPSAGGMEKSL